MKKLLATTVALGFTAAAAVAGPYMSSKEPVPPPPPVGCVCFDGGAIEVDDAGTYAWEDSTYINGLYATKMLSR